MSMTVARSAGEGHPPAHPSVNGRQSGLANDDAAWRATLTHELREGWPRWVSFACIWLWTCLMARAGFSCALAQSIGGVAATPTWFVLCATVATLVVIVFLSDALTTVVDSRGTMTLAGLLLVAGSVCVATAVPTAGGAMRFAVGSCLGGAAIGFLKIGWGEMFSRMSLRAGLIDIGLAVMSSAAAFLALLALPETAQRVALVVAAVPCASLAVRGARLLAGDPVPPAPPGAARAVRFSWTLLLLPALVGLSAGLLSGVLAARASQATSAVALWMTLAELAVGAFLLASSRALSARYGVSQIYVVGLIFSVAGLILASADAVPAWVPRVVNDLGFSTFYFFMVVYWGDLARRVGRSVVRTYAVGYASIMIAQVPGLLAGRLAAASPEGSTLALSLAALVLAFFVLSLLVFGDSRSALRRWLTAGEPAETSDAIPEACEAVATRHALSPREREVLSLLARGRTASFIGRSLGIAPDTAKTHMRSIYRKLDVHTQQELIDLIADEAASTGGASVDLSRLP